MNCYLTDQSCNEIYFRTNSSYILKKAVLVLTWSQLLFYIYTVISSSICSGTWKEFFQCTMEIDGAKWVNNESKKSLFIFDRVFLLVVVQTILIGFTVLDFAISHAIVENRWPVLIPTWIYFYQEAFTVFLAITILRYFKAVLEDIKATLLNNQMISMKMISTATQTYLKLTRAVDLFNALFGKHFLILLIISLTESLLLWYLVYTNMNSKFQNEQVYGTTVFWIISILTIHFWLTYNCDRVERTTDSLLSACYTVQEGFSSSSEEHRDLEVFAARITNKRIQFTASNYFDLNRRTVFCLFFNLTTYFIALVQFGHAQSEST
ncbi:uncharacterized protein [Euwallacea fornicatus]|uniref:uncharacterized protein n=1 Tax=Euwallacea fornicatus TaxID=995702 RepID=UPI00339024AB